MMVGGCDMWARTRTDMRPVPTVKSENTGRHNLNNKRQINLLLNIISVTGNCGGAYTC